MSRARLSARQSSWVSLVLPCVFLVLWEGVSRLGLVSPVLLSRPTRIVSTGYELLGHVAFQRDMLFSLQVFAVSLLIAGVFGTSVGLLIGTNPIAYRLLHPFLVVFNALPKIVLMPLIVLWIGIGAPASVFLAALMASFPIIVSTHAGVRALERDFLQLAEAFGASRALRFKTIVLPGITPYLLAGLRLGINYAMVGVLIAEFFASSKGVGYRMLLSMSNFQIEAFYVCLCLVAVFALCVTGLVQWAETRLLAWRPDTEGMVTGL